MPSVKCNTTVAKEHGSEAERTIRMLKERTRGLLSTLPFDNMPQRMKIKLVYFMVLWMYAFPVKSRVSDKILPRELLLQWRLNYMKHCRVEPGTYCEVHDERTPTNTMTPQTHEVIALGPTGNLQGSVKFYCIHTGRVLKRRSFTPMPMPDHVIWRVNAIGTREGQGCAFRFLNRQSEPYEWTDEVPEDDPEFQGLLDENEVTAVYTNISAELPGAALEKQECELQTIMEEPEPEFRDFAEAALHNAGIDADEALWRAHLGTARDGPAIIDAKDNEIVYQLTFNLPDTGLQPADGDAAVVLGDDRNNNTAAVIPVDTAAKGRRYPT